MSSRRDLRLALASSRLLLVVSVAAFFTATGFAANGTISIDFVGQATAMTQQETAGVVAKSFWNNASGTSNASELPLVDETGKSTTAVVTWTSDNVWALPIADQAGNVRMMEGYLDTANGNPTTVRISGLSAGTYDIYVYADASNMSATKSAVYQISGTGIVTFNTNWTDPPNTNYNGTFVQALNSSGNYVKFSGITATGFTLTATPGTASDGATRAAVNGIQIVPTAAAPTYSISGTITGGGGASVALTGAASATVTANASGGFTFTGLLNGTYTVTPALAGYTISPANQIVTISGANPPALNFTATAAAPTYSISGTITGGGGASVALAGTASATVTANASGGFTFTGLLNGTYTVTPTLAGYTISPANQIVTISGANPPALNFAATATAASIQLTNNANDYTIQNDFYQAVIPKSGQAGGGLIRFLYIRKQNGQWSNNLLKENTSNYGLGYLEGTDVATVNEPWGLSTPSVVIIVLENTSTRIKIQSTNFLYGTEFSETWTFWAGRRYFQSEATAVVTQAGGFLTNQLQFCWMINDGLPSAQYGTDNNGSVVQYNSRVMQPLNSPNLNTYPWTNWQFTGENVSLGLIFTSVYDHLGTIAETGDWLFEYQIDFELGTGALGSPENQGYTRAVTTVYYTDNLTTNADIAAFAQSHYQSAPSAITANPILQAAKYVTNPWAQNPGDGSALLNAPYFLVRQNTQNRDSAIEHTQYETSIYGPLYKKWTTIHPDSYDFRDQLQYSLNYDSDTTHFSYGTIAIQNVINGAITSLQARAISSDGKLAYNTTLQTWNDSDKLEIQGVASNASASASVKAIYALLSGKEIGATFSNLGPNLYDLIWNDDMYGKMGIAVKVNSPANTTVINGTDLYAYMYNQPSAQTLTTFSYGFDIVIWPHKGWLSGPADFTALHSQDIVTYDRRTLNLEAP